MGEYAKLIQQGVYCESCGYYTGQEPGYPIKCEGCDHYHSEAAVESAVEGGEDI